MTAKRAPATIFGLLLALQLTACTDDSSSSLSHRPGFRSDDSAPLAHLRVIESFDVGQGVYVRALAMDRNSHRMWVGTSVGALEVDAVNGKMLTTYTRDNALANEYVFAIFAASDGAVWFGTNGGGASRFGDGQWRTFFPLHGLADYWVYAFTQQTNGTVWIGTWAGLNAYDPASGKFKTYLKELVNEWVYGLDVDARDRVWVGTEGGVNMFDGNTWRTWTHADGLGADNKRELPFSANTGLGTRSRHDLSVMVNGRPSYNPNYVFDIEVAADGGVWAGTWGGGASRYDGQNWRNFTEDDGLSGNIVYAIAEDRDGGLWFGTDKGLSYYDGSAWAVVSDEALHTHVYAIAVSTDGSVWAGTRGSVVRVVRQPR